MRRSRPDHACAYHVCRSGLNVITVSADGTTNESRPPASHARGRAPRANARAPAYFGNPQGIGRAAELGDGFSGEQVARPGSPIDEANWAQKTRASKLRPITPHVSSGSAPSCVGSSRSSALESIRSSSAESSKWRCAFMPVVTARHDVWGRARRVGDQAQRRGFEAW